MREITGPITDEEIEALAANPEELLRRAYKWFGVDGPKKYTHKTRDDFGLTMKAFSLWIRRDKEENAEWWEEWNATLGLYF